MATEKFNSSIYHGSGVYFEVIDRNKSAYGDPKVFFITKSPEYAYIKSTKNINIYKFSKDNELTFRMFDYRIKEEIDELFNHIMTNNIKEFKNINEMYRDLIISNDNNSWEFFDYSPIRIALIQLKYQGFFEKNTVNSKTYDGYGILDDEILSKFPKPDIIEKDKFKDIHAYMKYIQGALTK